MATSNGTPEIEISSNGAGMSQSNIGKVQQADIIGEMQVAYLDYAMSVIVARALPDVRDGLKPVHRRILYAMWNDLSLTHDKPHKKSARIVGEVLGKYHPHGDVAVYDAMVRMAQDFSLRYPLIDGQGNFGSIDGDNAAAMRYTEARLASLSDWMLTDIEKDTVEWKPNFDNSLEEPGVLPSAVPNLLINGANGIAVGMATNVPPHNLSEVVDALSYVIDHFDQVDDISVEQLLEFIKGPDFPTGGILYRFREDKEEQVDAIAQGYSVGKSRLIIQAKAHFEEMGRGRQRIVITELPYQSSKTAIIERIADLVRNEKLVGISDLRDESDRTGMRVCIELQRGADPKAVLGDLFKYTPLQQTFGMQLLALVDGMPRLLNLKRMLQLFIQHRQEIVRRRSEWELKRARERAHILEGLLKALDILDEVIATIRRSQTVETARKNLMENFKFTEIQAQAILDMQLRRLAALERKKLQEEFNELRKRIQYLEELLADPKKILAVIKEELLALKAKYGDARRTQIVDRTKGALTTTDLLPDQQVWVTVNQDGDLRRQAVAQISQTQQRAVAKQAKVALLTANTRDFLYVFCKDGRCARLAIHEIPQDGSAKHLADLCSFTRRDAITAALPLSRQAGSGFVFLATERGNVKRISVSDFAGAVNEDTTVINVEAKDRLIAAFCTDGSSEVMLITNSGQSIRFAEEDVRSMGLAAGGVAGIKLGKDEKVVYATRVEPQGNMLTITTQGFAKQTEIRDYSSQGRNGGGIVTHKVTPKIGDVAAALLIGPEQQQGTVMVLISKNNPAAVPLAEVPIQGRGVQGKQIAPISVGSEVVGITMVQMPGDENNSPSSAEEEKSASKGTDKAKAPAAGSSSGKSTTKPVEASKPIAAGMTQALVKAAGQTPDKVAERTVKAGSGEVSKSFVPAATEKKASEPAKADASKDANPPKQQPPQSPAKATEKPASPAKDGKEPSKTTVPIKAGVTSKDTRSAGQPSLFELEKPTNKPVSTPTKKVQAVTSVVKKK
ncbi:MAG: DNA gyrase subunit A [Caldilineaceae bacterium]